MILFCCNELVFSIICVFQRALSINSILSLKYPKTASEKGWIEGNPSVLVFYKFLRN